LRLSVLQYGEFVLFEVGDALSRLVGDHSVDKDESCADAHGRRVHIVFSELGRQRMRFQEVGKARLLIGAKS
jgi:hypothetical protein